MISKTLALPTVGHRRKLLEAIAALAERDTVDSGEEAPEETLPEPLLESDPPAAEPAPAPAEESEILAAAAAE